MAGADPFSLEGIDRIPDPAASTVARVARRPIPPAALPAEASPTRDARRLVTRVAVVASALWLGGALLAAGVRADIAEPLVIGPLLAWSMVAAAGLLFVLRPRTRGLPAPVRAVQHAIWIVPAVYVAVVLGVGVPSNGPPLAWGTIRTCLGLAHLMALGPLVAAALLLRGSFLSASAWRGTAVGALAGLVGSIGVHAHCAVPSLNHLLAAHGPAILVGALLGGILGRARGSA